MSQLTAAQPDTLLTRRFIFLCLSMFFAFSTHAMMIPCVPLYIDHMGGSPFIAGLALLAFSIPTIAVRPFLGRLADQWSARAVLAGGLVLSAFASSLFLIPTAVMVFTASVLRGLGWAGVNIGGYTVLAGAAPSHRRGEAAGYYTSAISMASVIFPALALWMIDGHGSFDWVFVLCSVVSLMGVPTAILLRGGNTLPDAAAPAGAETEKLIDRGVFVATALNLSTTLALPAAMAFMPLYARSLGIQDIAYFYILAGIINIVVRPILGRRSDAMGRGPSIAMGLILQFFGFVLIVAANTLGWILAGGVLVSLGSALIVSASTALALDLAKPGSRGRSMATFSISFQLGAGLGAIIAGALADFFGLRAMFAGAIAITLAGLALLANAWKSLPQPSR